MEPLIVLPVFAVFMYIFYCIIEDFWTCKNCRHYPIEREYDQRHKRYTHTCPKCGEFEWR